MVTMTVTRCLSSFFSRFLQRMVQEFLALFQFSETGAIKREARLAAKDANREQQVIGKVQELAKGGPFPAEAVGRFYQKLIEEMRNWEQKLNDAATPQSSSQPVTTGASK